MCAYLYLSVWKGTRNDVQKDTEKPAGLVSPQPCPAPRHPFYPGLLGAGIEGVSSERSKFPHPDFHLVIWRLLLSLSQELPCFPSAVKKRNLPSNRIHAVGSGTVGSELDPRFTFAMRMLGPRCACCNLGYPIGLY